MHGADVSVTAGSYAALRPSLEHQHDVIVGHPGDQELLVQPARGAGAVLPPPVGTGADDVGGVDDQDRGHYPPPPRKLGP